MQIGSQLNAILKEIGKKKKVRKTSLLSAHFIPEGARLIG